MRLDDIRAEHVVAFGCRDELTADTRFNQVAAALCETYEGLDAQHKAAVDETNAVDRANTLIAETIAHIWQAKQLPDNIHDVTAEKQFIEIMRLKYVYPDYADLVGPPAESDFVEVTCRDGTVQWKLTFERKADLLLLGTFDWKGMYIARMHTRHPSIPKGWVVFLDAGYAPEDPLGAYFLDYRNGWGKLPRYGDEKRKGVKSSIIY